MRAAVVARRRQNGPPEAGGLGGRPATASRAGLALALVGTLFGLVTTRLKINDGTHPWWDVALTTASGYLFLIAGAVALARRPENRVGVLMVVTGVATFAEDLQLAASPAVHSIGILLAAASTAPLAHLMLAFPSGRLLRRADRIIVGVAYAWSFGLMAIAAVFARTATPNLLLVADIPLIRDAVGQLGLPIALATFASLMHRWYTTRPQLRHVLTPVVVLNVLIGVSAVGAAAVWNTELGLYRPFVIAYQIAACLLPLAFLAGVLRVRLGRSAVARLVEALNAPVAEAHLRALLGRALGDPQLAIGYVHRDGSGYVDSDGAPMAVPARDNPRLVATEVTHNGQTVAVLIHDRALLEDDHVLRAVTAAAGLALENARLHAELRAQLAEVRRSRARIVTAGQVERARIERDLHDALQAGLVASLIALRQARQHGTGADAALDRASLALETALADLRRIAHGIRPALLVEAGLGPAVRTLLDGSGLRFTLEAGSLTDATPAVEETIYFVVAEAVANALKYAHATRLTVTIAQHGGELSAQVCDDGVGGAELTEGGGLQGLEDRVRALGGWLTVGSVPTGGTAVAARLPLDPPSRDAG